MGNLRLEIEAEMHLACRRLGASWDILPTIRIGRGLYKACEDLGADAQLLAIIDSYCNTLSDCDVRKVLKEYNAEFISSRGHGGAN